MRPVLLHVPLLNRPLYAYGVMIGVSFAVGWYLVLWLCDRDLLPRRETRRLWLTTAFSALVLARFLYVITNPGERSGILSVVDFTRPGLVAYGGFLGGFLGSAVTCRLRGLSLLAWADCVVPALGTGLAFTRIGCFLNGCDFGKPTTLPWAVSFPRGSLAWIEQVRQGLIARSAASSLQVHPTQLYEVGIGLALFALVMWVRSRHAPAGAALASFAGAYAVARYVVELYRADPDRGAVGVFSTSQVIAIVTFLAAAGLAAALRFRLPRAPA